MSTPFDLREAAQQALEALELAYGYSMKREEAIEALKAALAEPVQERKPRHVSYVCPQCHWSLDERKPLTEEEIAEASAGVLGLPHEIKVELARAIERAHGIGEKE